MRVKVDFFSASRDQYNKFCNEYKESSITYEKWKEIIYKFNYDFRDYILTYGDKVKIPFGFGNLSINKRKVRKTRIVDGIERIALPVDWKKTREKGRYIYNFNYHTEGYRFKWMWWPVSARFRHSLLWNFKPSRVSSRKITEFLAKEDADYVNVYKEWK